MSTFYDAFHTWYARLNVIEIDPPGALFDVGREDFYAYPGSWPDGLGAVAAGFGVRAPLTLSRFLLMTWRTSPIGWVDLVLLFSFAGPPRSPCSASVSLHYDYWLSQRLLL